MDQLVVTELIQNELTPQNITRKLKLLEDPNSAARQKLTETYTELEKKLGGGGASDHVAKLILNFSNQEKG
jgi:lipid-A-disaccharide synthase